MVKSRSDLGGALGLGLLNFDHEKDLEGTLDLFFFVHDGPFVLGKKTWSMVLTAPVWCAQRGNHG